MKFFGKVDGYELLFILLLLALSFPIIPAYITPFRKIWIVLTLSFVVTLIVRMRLYKGQGLTMLIIYSIIIVINSFCGDAMFSSIPVCIVEILTLYVPCVIFFYVISYQRAEFVTLLLVSSACFFLFECISTYVILKTSPGLVRTLYSTANQADDINIMYQFYKYGMIDYAMCHAIPVLIPPLFYMAKVTLRTITKCLSLAGIFICFYLVYLSDSTTSLLLSILLILMGFVTKPGLLSLNIKKLIVLVIIALPFIMSDNIQIIVLDSLEGVLGSESVFADKIDELRQSILYDVAGNDMQGRIDRYTTSLLLFKQNPLLGGNGKVGNHAALIDHLGSLGIIGFIPLCMFFLSMFRFTKSHLPNDSLTFYYEGLFASILMLALKGMWFWPMFFCVFLLLPFIILSVDSNKLNHA